MITLTNSTLFTKHSVRELLFDGYLDDFINETVHMKILPKPLPYSRFGWFYGKNDSATQDEFEIYTGKSDLNRLGLINSWHNKTELNIWNGDCNVLNDSNQGDLQPPFKESGHINIFVSSICRSLRLNHKEIVYTRAVSANRYAADKSLFDYSIAANQCYCYNDS